MIRFPLAPRASTALRLEPSQGTGSWVSNFLALQIFWFPHSQRVFVVHLAGYFIALLSLP